MDQTGPRSNAVQDRPEPDRPPTHFVFIDARPAVAEALSLAFEQQQIGTASAASSTEELIGSGRLERGDVVVVNVGNVDHETVDVAASLLHAMPGVRLIAASSSDREADIAALRAAGFRGFVEKSASFARLADVAVAVSRGRLAFPTPEHDAATRPPSPDAQARLLARHLTERERQILGMLVDGASGTEIADELEIQSTTVRTHIQNIMMKLQVHTRLQAVMFAVRHGLVTMPQSETG